MVSEIALDRLCDFAFSLSINSQDKTTDWRGHKTSIVFGKVAATCATFLKLIPGSPSFTPFKRYALWDLASAASLCRNLVEAYYVLAYLCREPESSEEAHFQERLWDYHEIFQRQKMLQAVSPSSAHLPKLESTLNAKKDKLVCTSKWEQLSNGRQKELLKGKDFTLLSQQEIAREAGISVNYHRGVYGFCSAHTHCAPFSVSQLNEFQAGNVESERVIGTLVEYTTGFTALAIRDFTSLFLDPKPEIPESIQEIVQFWQDIVMWDQSPFYPGEDRGPCAAS
jgi:hypothetical protein